MCDSILLAGPTEIWLAKNSDREPGEAQAVEWIAGEAAADSRHARRRCTHVEIDDRGPRHAVVLSRPAWMWGAEMGVNEHGLAIANEAVFTRQPVAARGLTGMDLLRLALERAHGARQGVDVITQLLQRVPQGGAMGHRDRRFRYHSSFLLADAEQAWVLETAGWAWAARRVHGVYTASNALTIGTDHDDVHPDAARHAVAQGWWDGRGEFDFAAAYGDRAMTFASGAAPRRACSRAQISSTEDPFSTLASALRCHADGPPSAGWRMKMPCAHASWLPTRSAGQTTGSMIARAGSRPRVWMTGTSSPCLSVFKPVAVDRASTGGHGHTAEAPDGGLWWAHERLHRCALGDYGARAPAGADERAQLEARARTWLDPDDFAQAWREHRDAVDRWRDDAARRGRSGRRPFHRFWARQSRRDALW